MTLEDKDRTEIEELLVIPDAQERLAWLIRKADEGGLAQEECTDADRVTGCVSAVWVRALGGAEACHFRSHADSPMVKGLVAFLCRYFNGLSAKEILRCETDPMVRLGLVRILTITRLNGLAAVRARILAYAKSRL